MTVHPLAVVGGAALALVATPALAQHLPAVAPPSASASASAAALVGHWLHDSRGEVVGSVRSISPDGRIATIVLGIYTLDNLRVIQVPASALSVMDGKVTLRREPVEALNAFPSR